MAEAVSPSLNPRAVVVSSPTVDELTCILPELYVKEIAVIVYLVKPQVH